MNRRRREGRCLTTGGHCFHNRGEQYLCCRCGQLINLEDKPWWRLVLDQLLGRNRPAA